NGSPPAYTEVPQSTHLFVAVDNDQNGIRDDDHFALLEALLNGTGCVPGTVPRQAIRDSFQFNRARITATELTLTNVRVSFTALGGLISYDRTITVKTGEGGSPEANCLPEIPIVGTTCFDVPSLYDPNKPGGSLLDSDDYPFMRSDTVDLAAGFMTMGDQYGINYWKDLQAVVIKRVIVDVLPRLLQDLKKGAPLPKDYGEAVLRGIMEGLAAQAFPPDAAKGAATNWSCAGIVNIDQTVPVDISGVGTVNVRIRVPAASICTALTNYINSFSCANYQCQGARLSIANPVGNLNADGQSNVTSYALAPGNRSMFLGYECAEYPESYIFSQVPQGNLDAGGVRVPGSDISPGSWTYDVQLSMADKPYRFQWYYKAPGEPAYAPYGDIRIGGLLQIDGLTAGDHYFYARVLGSCCASDTDTVITGIRVVPITITRQPPDNFSFVIGEGADEDLVDATISDSTELVYQWYRRLIGETTFVPYGAPNADGRLIFDIGATQADRGTYFCRVTSVVHEHHRDTQHIQVFPTVFSTRIYDPYAGLGTQGRSLIVSGKALGDITINTDANPPTLAVEGGSTYTGEVDSGVAVFRFDKVEVTTGTVTVSGSRPLSIVAAGDVLWGVGVIVPPGTLGGGAGGQGGTGGGGGAGGTGGAGGRGGSGGGGASGRSGDGDGKTGGSGSSGLPGSGGGSGAEGDDGEVGSSGLPGFGGFSVAGGGGGGGTGGGGAGAGASSGSSGGSGGGGGIGGAILTGVDGQPGGAGGSVAAAAPAGDNAEAGGAGSPGGAAETLVDANALALAAGGGGGGGGGGQGGGGGGGG
ncbi:MAG TPA: hypothetical protein PKL84_11085, partial [Candidatus Hydrogenedentes bacterium]|nr:hypothetical protein [Candidatus Hydrogenedentota bacterium]